MYKLKFPVLLIALFFFLEVAAFGQDVTTPGDPVVGVPDNSNWPSNEAPQYAVDNNINTKYLHKSGVPCGIIISPQKRTGEAVATLVEEVAFTTANDDPVRDPHSFELYGSNNEVVSLAANWTLIASGPIVDFEDGTWPRKKRNSTPVFFDNSTEYLHYKLIFPTNGGDPYVQVAEVELIEWPADCRRIKKDGLLMAADLNQDCKVDLADFIRFALNWLRCNDPDTQSCDNPYAEFPYWAIGPFLRPENAQPVIKPNPDTVFYCPMRQDNIHWEKLHTFNPAAVVKDGKINVMYRAEDDTGQMHVGGHTSRGGLAPSLNGIDFTFRNSPVLYPDVDDQADFEWMGGCEDPRIAEREDGLFIVAYTQYTGVENDKRFRLGLASSIDLVNWTKHGSPFAGTAYDNLRIKSASVVHEVVDGHLLAAKIQGKYWMYFGERSVHVATSDDLIHWTPLEVGNGQLLTVMNTRSGHFDSMLTEVGPQLILTENGIVLIYNGKNADPAKNGDPDLPYGVYACGQALFDRDDPTRLITRLDKPFFKPELDWEKSGQYVDGTTFSEGLVLYNGNWYLYYGCADSFVGVAIAPFFDSLSTNTIE